MATTDQCRRCGGPLERPGTLIITGGGGQLPDDHELRDGVRLCWVCIEAVDDRINEDAKSPDQILEETTDHD